MGDNNISAWAIRHPVPTLVLFILLTVAGAVAFPTLRINNNPDIDLPMVTVTVTQAGAAPSELETQVTRRIEDAVAGLGDVNHINSTVADGASTTIVEFQLGKDLDRAVNDVRDKVTEIREDLPADAQEPIIRRVDMTGMPILTYTIRAPEMTEQQTSWFVDDTVTKALLSVGGVGQVNRIGGVDREIRVSLDPDRLMALGVTAADVNEQIRLINVNSPGGRGTLGGSEQSIRTLGSAVTVEELRERMITLPGGRKARLGDIGTVEDVPAEQRKLARLGDEMVVGFDVVRTVGSSEVAVAERVERKVAELREQYPEIEITKVASLVKFVKESYEGALEALIEGAVLAILVVFIFLRDWRATIISAVAMPLSLIPTFFVMKWAGFSLNGVSLLALGLVVGILVDDAIVEIENIVRHMRGGKKPYRAALEAADEIGLAVVATTLSIVAVFLPVAFMPGIAGQFFKVFALTVVTSVLFSLLVARTLTPLMGAYFLKFKEHVPRDGLIMRAYLAHLRWALRHRLLTLLGGVAFFIGSIMLVPLLPSDFIPAQDIGRSAVGIELPPGSTLEDTDRAARRAVEIIRKRPEVVSTFTSIGGASGGMPGFGGSSHGEVRKATIIINLKPADERELSQQEFEAALRPELAAIPGVRTRFGADGMSGARLTVTLVGDDPEVLDKAAQELERQMRTLPAFPTASSTASLRRPELQIRPSPDRAAELGVSVAAIATTARIATLGDADQNLAKFNLPSRQIPIRVQLTDAARGDLGVLRSLRVTSADGTPVPLAAVADITFGSGPATIERIDRTRKATVESELSGLALGEALAQVEALPIMQDLPDGVRRMNTGDAEVMAELFLGFAVALGSGVLLVYTVMVVLFGGFLQPLTIMTALPMSLGGALIALLLTGHSLSISAVIGILMLMGIVAKNSILLVEYAIESYRAGVSRTEALVDAAHKRARPIVMTTIAMTAGMLPIALGLGADAEFRAPMGIGVIGGLITSTVLSLVFVPIVFTYMDGLENRLGRRLGRLLSSGPKDMDEPVAPAPQAGE